MKILQSYNKSRTVFFTFFVLTISLSFNWWGCDTKIITDGRHSPLASFNKDSCYAAANDKYNDKVQWCRTHTTGGAYSDCIEEARTQKEKDKKKCDSLHQQGTGQGP